MSTNIGDSMDNKRKLEADPIEAIFELNMGDFLTEYLISDDLLNKINTSNHDNPIFQDNRWTCKCGYKNRPYSDSCENCGKKRS